MGLSGRLGPKTRTADCRISSSHKDLENLPCRYRTGEPRQVEPVFAPQDLVNLPNHTVYLKLMIDGTPSKPHAARERSDRR
jgi:hypothetical protein